tara:strand:+ start:2228 stop:2575 length:348 start_codon:yes stop_codon:yes gene_type:complete
MKEVSLLPTELQSKIFLYVSFLPFKRTDLEKYIEKFKPIYFEYNYDLYYIFNSQYKAIKQDLLKKINYDLNKLCMICPYIIKNVIIENIYFYKVYDVKHSYFNKHFNKRFVYDLM